MNRDCMVDQVVAEARDIIEQLANHDTIGRYVDRLRDIPRPFAGSGEIRLVIIGQDPTVEREASRNAIRTVLNLDRRGALRALSLPRFSGRPVYAASASRRQSVSVRFGLRYPFVECNLLAL